MKQVFALPESAELELLKNMLEEAGIRCAFRSEQLSQALLATPFNVELWVANDDDFPRAQELCQGWVHPPPAGLWIDHREAVIVLVSHNGRETKRITSHVEKQLRRSGRSPSGEPFESQMVPADDPREREYGGHLAKSQGCVP